ncbi:hypothetical protein [Pseudomonas sp. JV449]|uniref:hypothetical protein n=1 Tax=Pseudomonas sp. JV449 TaxID=1890658 RepID=UPI0028F3F9EC|nr:hypothetical protein [Pseudomonas sp. JV449]
MQIAFGSGLFYATPLMDAYGNAISVPTPILLGIMQEASVDLSFDSKELFGSEQFAVDAARGQGKLTGKAKSAQISLLQWNQLVFGQTLTTGQVLVHHSTEPTAVPAGATITVDPPAGGTLSGDLGVRVLSAPIAGQYTFDAATGEYAFAAADVAKSVFIDYRYTVTTGKSLSVKNLPMGDMPVFQGELVLKYKGKTVYVRVPNFVSNKLGIATKQDDYTIPDFEFTGYADEFGEVCYWSANE